MMHAYNERYLNDAAVAMAEITDYVINDRNISGEDFMHMFIASGVAKQFERGSIKYITGRSGIEIADEVIRKVTGDSRTAAVTFRENKTAEYWAGWVLAQYQWYTARSFDDILRYLPFLEIIKQYSALHEADITKFYEYADQLIALRKTQTNLRRIRTAAGITQEKLAQESGVSLRSIQMYEQRNKDINKAQAITLAKISRVLGCEIEDLLEQETE